MLSTIEISCIFQVLVQSNVNFPVAHYGPGIGPNLRTEKKNNIGRDTG